MHCLAIVHHLPERTRLRSPALRRDPAACERVADALAQVPGVREVRVRPYTGSVLIDHEGADIAALTGAASRALGGARILAPGEMPPPATAVPAFSTLRDKVAAIARELDRDVRRGSDGSVDLGTLATLGLLGTGAIGIATSGQLQMPPWFNLTWWAYRTFMTTMTNRHANRDTAPEPAPAGEPASPAPEASHPSGDAR